LGRAGRLTGPSRAPQMLPWRVHPPPRPLVAALLGGDDVRCPRQSWKFMSRRGHRSHRVVGARSLIRRVEGPRAQSVPISWADTTVPGLAAGAWRHDEATGARTIWRFRSPHIRDFYSALDATRQISHARGEDFSARVFAVASPPHPCAKWHLLPRQRDIA
jgi:hypothetical protein